MDREELDRLREALGDLDYVNWCLRGSYRDSALRRWWIRPREQLGGQSPIDVWETRREDVIKLAEDLLA